MNEFINVNIRIKPENSIKNIWSIDKNRIGYVKDGKLIAFDCFKSIYYKENTKQIYDEQIKPKIKRFLVNENITVMAYGQTGSGKTYTMSGEKEDGVINYALKDILPNKITISYIEIYNENVYDLYTLKDVKVFAKDKETVFNNLHDEEVETEEEAREFLRICNLNRRMSATEYNISSSRSHCIIKIKKKNNLLTFVDLAGSEKACESEDRRKEGGYINKSLLALGKVISNLVSNRHVSFRESKLTRILNESFNSNNNFVVFCMLSAMDKYLEEGLSTLQFAARMSNLSLKTIELKAPKKMLYEQVDLANKNDTKFLCCNRYCCCNKYKNKLDELVKVNEDKLNELVKINENELLKVNEDKLNELVKVNEDKLNELVKINENELLKVNENEVKKNINENELLKVNENEVNGIDVENNKNLNFSNCEKTNIKITNSSIEFINIICDNIVKPKLNKNIKRNGILFEKYLVNSKVTNKVDNKVNSMVYKEINSKVNSMVDKEINSKVNSMVDNKDNDNKDKLLDNKDNDNKDKLVDNKVNSMVDNKDKLLDNKDKLLDNKDKLLDNKDKLLDNKDKLVDNKDKEVDNKVNSMVDNKDKLLDNKDKLLDNKVNSMVDKDKLVDRNIDSSIEKNKSEICNSKFPKVVTNFVNYISKNNENNEKNKIDKEFKNNENNEKNKIDKIDKEFKNNENNEKNKIDKEFKNNENNEKNKFNEDNEFPLSNIYIEPIHNKTTMPILLNLFLNSSNKNIKINDCSSEFISNLTSIECNKYIKNTNNNSNFNILPSKLQSIKSINLIKIDKIFLNTFFKKKLRSINESQYIKLVRKMRSNDNMKNNNKVSDLIPCDPINDEAVYKNKSLSYSTPNNLIKNDLTYMKKPIDIILSTNKVVKHINKHNLVDEKVVKHINKHNLADEKVVKHINKHNLVDEKVVKHINKHNLVDEKPENIKKIKNSKFLKKIDFNKLNCINVEESININENDEIKKLKRFYETKIKILKKIIIKMVGNKK